MVIANQKTKSLAGGGNFGFQNGEAFADLKGDVELFIHAPDFNSDLITEGIDLYIHLVPEGAHFISERAYLISQRIHLVSLRIHFALQGVELGIKVFLIRLDFLEFRNNQFLNQLFNINRHRGLLRNNESIIVDGLEDVNQYEKSTEVNEYQTDRSTGDDDGIIQFQNQKPN